MARSKQKPNAKIRGKNVPTVTGSHPFATTTTKKNLTKGELQTATYIVTMILAGVAIVMHVETPAVWGFLSTAIAIAFGVNRNG